MRKESKEKKERFYPEGYLAVLFVLLGMFIGIAIMFFFVVKAFAAETDVETLAIAEPIPFEEQIEHDLEITFQEWMREQKNNEDEYLIEVTQEDIDLMARVVMSEASILSYDAKQAIAQTIVNRVRTNFRDFRNQNSVSEVVNFPNAYSTQDNGEPNADCYAAVEAALIYEAFPPDMYWFREDQYHNFGIEYCNIGTTYFSRGGDYEFFK